jgi:hypothetical protein
MLRVYDKRLNFRPKAEKTRLHTESDGNWNSNRIGPKPAQSLLTLDPEDWRAFLVGVLRSYVDFRETTREAESYEKYRAPLLAGGKL